MGDCEQLETLGGTDSVGQLDAPSELAQRGLRLMTGRNFDLEEQLILKSWQLHIRRNTPDDANVRFPDRATLDARMQEKNPTMHWLVNDSIGPPFPSLAGVIWYRPKPFPEDVALPEEQETPELTFAGRIYLGYIKTRLSKPFMRASLRLLASDPSRGALLERGIWLQTSATNDDAMHAFQKFGYQEVGRNDEDRITMILSAKMIQEILHD